MIFYFTTTNGNSGATIASSKSHVTGGNRVAGTSIPNVTDSLLFHPSHTPCTTRRARAHGRAHTRSHTRTHTTTAVAQFQPEAEGTFRRTHTSPFEARETRQPERRHTHASAESARYAGRTHTRFRHTRLLRTLGRESSQTHTHEQKLALSLFSLFASRRLSDVLSSLRRPLSFLFPGYIPFRAFVLFRLSPRRLFLLLAMHHHHHRQPFRIIIVNLFSIKRVIVFIRPHIRCLKATVLIRQHRRTAPYISVFLHASHIAVGRLSFSIWPRPRFNRTFLSLYDFSSTQ